MTGILPTPTTVLSATNLTYSTTSDVMTAGVTESGVGVSASWTTSAPAAVTFDSGTKATAVVDENTFTALVVGPGEHVKTIQYLDSTKASKSLHGLTYTADAKGSGGNAITIAYTTGGSAGNEVVGVVGNAITVQIQDNGLTDKTFTTGTLASGTIQDISYKVKTAFASAVNNVQVRYAGGGFGGQESAARSGTGAGGDPYLVTVTMQGDDEYTTKTFNAGTSDTVTIQDLTYTRIIRGAGVYYSVDYNEGVALSVAAIAGTGTAIDPYRIVVTLETGVSDADAVKAAVDAVWNAVIDCAVSGTNTDIQTAFATAQMLTGGTASDIALATNVITTTTAHGYIPGTRIRFTGTGLPTVIAGTNYWVKTTPAGNTMTISASYGGAEFDILAQGNSGETFSIVPYATRASEIDTAIGADANSTALLARTVNVAAAAENTQIATALTGGVASAIDQTANTITVATHGLATGQKVTIAGGTLPTNLVSPAWVVATDGNTLKFANSYANATVGPVTLDIASDGDEATVYTISSVPSTAADIDAAITAFGGAATALVDVTVDTGATTAPLFGATALTGGYGGTAGNEQVVVSGNAATVYIQAGVTTGNQVETKWNNGGYNTTFATVGGGAGTNAATSAIALGSTTPGVANDFNKNSESNPNQITIAAHGLSTGQKVAITTGGTLPDNLTATDRYVIKVDDNTIKLATNLANAIAGTAITLVTDGSGQHTLTPAAVAGSCKMQWSINNSVWEDVPAGYGGETVADIGAATENLWSINSVQASYFRLVWTQSGGTTNSLVVVYTAK